MMTIATKLPRLLVFCAGFVGPLLLVNWVLARQDLPGYATWTGIRPLEQKLRQIEAFAAAGPVDAVALGSSIADFGFQAQRLSELMSEATGRPYRAFNFATGAAEISTFPLLYKLLRTVARPRCLLLMIPSQRRVPKGLREGSPDYYLAHAPVQVGLANAWFLPVWKRAWDLPMLQFAAPLRDLALYGSYRSLRGLGSDLYEVNAHGDRVSFLFERSTAKLLAARHSREHKIFPVAARFRSQPADTVVGHYFGDGDLEAMRELKRLTARDGCALRIVAHGSACLFFPDVPLSAEFVEARREYFAAIAAYAGAPLHFFLDDFRVPAYAVSDETHLNYYGAVAFSERLAASLTGQPVPHREEAAAPDLAVEGPTFNTLAFIILRRPPADGARLRLRFVRSIAVPALRQPILYVALRGRGGDHVVTARRLPDGDVEAAFTGQLSSRVEAFVGRLLTENGQGDKEALNQPLASYRWEEAW